MLGLFREKLFGSGEKSEGIITIDEIFEVGVKGRRVLNGGVTRAGFLAFFLEFFGGFCD